MLMKSLRVERIIILRIHEFKDLWKLFFFVCFFKEIMAKKNQDRIEKSVPCNHRSSSLDKPRVAKQ